MMNPGDEPKLTAYALGELSGSEEHAIRAELARDPALEGRVEETRRTASMMEAVLRDQEEGAELRPEQLRAIEELLAAVHTAPSPAPPRPRRAVWAAIGAACAFAIAGTAVFISYPTSTKPPIAIQDPKPSEEPHEKLPALVPAKEVELVAVEANTVRPLDPSRSRPDSPMTLTAQDGTGLVLVSLEARAVLEEPLAFTELHLRFQNPTPRTIEGQFKIRMPEGASVSRFAMRIGDRWQEGEVVERKAARRAYEDFLHRRQDPALLEQSAGNEFSARVFPIPAKGLKELIISYSEDLARMDDRYRLPLLGLPMIENLDVQVAIPGASPVGLRKTSYVPTADFEVEQTHARSRLGLRNGRMVVARLVPVLQSEPEEIRSLAILFDSSASRTLGYAKQIEQLKAVVAQLVESGRGSVPLWVACFDQTVTPIYDGPASGFGQEAIARIRAHKALGASDLGRALASIAHGERLLLITDGVPTAGPSEAPRLIELARKLRDAGVVRVDAIATGGIRDDALLHQLVTESGAHTGALIRESESATRIVERLTRATHSNIPVEVDGAIWTWPDTLDGIQAGDQVLVYAELPEDKLFTVRLGGTQMVIQDRVLADVERPLLERAWIKARIDKLSHARDTAPAKDRDPLAREIIDLSVQHRVLTPLTALLVLETEQDYRRYGIGRRGLSDILAVDGDAIAVRHRAETIAETKPAEAKPGPKHRIKSESKGEEGIAGKRDKGYFKTTTSDFSDESVEGALMKPDDTPQMSAGSDPQPPPAVMHGYIDPNAQPNEGESLRWQGHATLEPTADGKGKDGNKSSGAATRREAPPAAMDFDGDLPAKVAPPPNPPKRPDAERMRALHRAHAASNADLERAEIPLSSTPVAGGGAGARAQQPQGDRARRLAYKGPMAEVEALIAKRRVADALQRATAWREESPGDIMALVALGDALKASGDRAMAARAYGSLIDLFPARADMRRFAGELLESLRDGDASSLALDTYGKALRDRPDHPSAHRLYAYQLLRHGRADRAFEVIERALTRQFPYGRMETIDRTLREDLGLIAAAWIKRSPKVSGDVMRRLNRLGVVLQATPSIRFVLNWETDTNDVDLHVYDRFDNHAYYGARALASGGELFADVTTGYGPECFAIPAPKSARAYPYRLQVSYFRQGPMGFGMGKVEIIEHDGHGGLRFEERPFVIMVDQGTVDLGLVR
jgi:tetratricopeptide (TPR) repeat protein